MQCGHCAGLATETCDSILVKVICYQYLCNVGILSTAQDTSFCLHVMVPAPRFMCHPQTAQSSVPSWIQAQPLALSF